jgi:Tol biopolymer transport system component
MKTAAIFSLIYTILLALVSAPVYATAEICKDVQIISISPDSSRIIYGDDNGTWSVNVADGRTRHLTTIPDGEPPPDWLSFRKQRSGELSNDRPEFYTRDYGTYTKSHIWRRDPGKSKPVQVTSGPYKDRHPQLSPDRKWVVFQSDRTPYGVWKMRPDGSGMTHLIKAGGMNESYPVWSPDGSFIAFVKAPLRARFINSTLDYYGDAEVWIVRPDGTGLKQVSRINPFYYEGTISAAAWPWFRWVVLGAFLGMIGLMVFGIKCVRRKR